MIMERPIIKIEGTEFTFDIDTIMLVEKEDPNNQIDFRYMEDHGSHYSFLYSTKTKNYSFVTSIEDLFGSTENDGSLRNHEIYVEIPRIGSIDPEGMCRKYGCSPKDIEERSDFELMVDQQVFVERMKGMPVTIELPGKSYVVDVQKNMLIPIDDEGENIKLDKFHYDCYLEDEECYHLLYNLREKSVQDPLREPTLDTEGNLIMLEIPALHNLDPIGTNISRKRDPKFCLAYHDLTLQHVCKIVPWSIYGVEVNGPQLVGDEMTNKEIPREMPVYRLGEIDFRVDVRQRLLTDLRKPENIIKLDDLQFAEGKYMAYLDKEGRLASVTGNIGTEYELPQMVLLDPEGMAKVHGKTIEEISQLSDFDLLVDKDIFNERIGGRKPTLEIMGTTFSVDSLEGTLTSETSQILLFELDIYIKDDYYEFPYNTESKTVADIDFDTITAIPENTVWVRIPLDYQLDPVGWALLIGTDPKDACVNHRPKTEMSAECIQWKNTKIYEIMERNRKQNDMYEDQPTIKKQVQGRKKGRGI